MKYEEERYKKKTGAGPEMQVLNQSHWNKEMLGNV